MNGRNRLRRVAILLALLVLPAIVTGVAAPAGTTDVPYHLPGNWRRGGAVMHIDALGLGGIKGGTFHFGLVFERVAAHLEISGARSCSGFGTYHWKIANRKLKLTKIHDACKARVGWLAGTWRRAS